jgi:hypothetical protein
MASHDELKKGEKVQIVELGYELRGHRFVVPRQRPRIRQGFHPELEPRTDFGMPIASVDLVEMETVLVGDGRDRARVAFDEASRTLYCARRTSAIETYAASLER